MEANDPTKTSDPQQPINPLMPADQHDQHPAGAADSPPPLDHDDPVVVSAQEGRSVFDEPLDEPLQEQLKPTGDNTLQKTMTDDGHNQTDNNQPDVIGQININPSDQQGHSAEPDQHDQQGQQVSGNPHHTSDQTQIADESSGIYDTAKTQAERELLACPTSQVLSLSRDVDNVPLEDLGPARLPAAEHLRFVPVTHSEQADLTSPDLAHAPADDTLIHDPIPLTVGAVAAAGGVALTLGMPSPQDNPAGESSSEPQKSKGFFFRKKDSIKAPSSKRGVNKQPGKTRSGRPWFIPQSGKMPQERQAGRVDRFAAVCAAGVLGVMAVLAARVVQLQVLPDAKVASLKETQYSTATIHHRRGNIEDRNGRPLAATTAGKSVYIDPGLITDAKAFSAQVGPALNIEPAKLEATIDAAGEKRYVKVVKRATHEQADNLADLKKVKPLGTQTILVRDYPYKTLAAHLLGFVDMDGKGIEGVERLFNNQLSGQAGGFTYNRDARHRSLWINDGNYRLPDDGQSVRLSIDITIQRIAERELADACRKFEAKSGAALVMSPITGEILGLAVYPEVDANSFGKADPGLRKNHAITDIYEPGSTFKPFVWAVATEQGYARPMEMLDCGPGRWVSSTGRRLKDAHPVGRATWEEVLVKSSNIGMAIVGERMGREPLYNAINVFGFGKKTGSGLPGEVSGIFHPTKRWTSYSITSLPMGHEISVTPIQMARAYCALANGGVLVTPTIKYVDPDSAQGQTPHGPRAIKEETAIHTRNVMRRVVLEGTGKQANSKLYSIFGKTGTAQMPNPRGGGYEPDAYVGSFACGAPVDDAKVVVVTIIQRPNRKIAYYGGTIAAPAGMRIVEQTLAYMGVAPDVVPQEDNRKPKSPDLSKRVMSVGNR